MLRDGDASVYYFLHRDIVHHCSGSRYSHRPGSSTSKSAKRSICRPSHYDNSGGANLRPDITVYEWWCQRSIWKHLHLRLC